jgi:hypothetical protein
VPYQLHCDAPLQADEATLELVEARLLELGLELEITLEELFTELELVAKLDDVFTELDALVVATLLLTTLEHTAPVIVGFSEIVPFLSPCTPKLTD